MISAPSYIVKNRYGIFYFQYRIPLKFLTIFNGKKLIRISLRTKIRKDALKRARRWWLIMDKLIYQFFESPKFFGKGMELLMKYRELDDAKVDYETMLEFLDNLDDWEGDALDQAIEYEKAKSKSIAALRDENQFLKKVISLLDNKIPEPHKVNLSASLPPVSTNAETPLLSELIKQYLEECSNKWDSKHCNNNKRDLMPKLNLFLEVVGDKYANEIKKEDVARFKKILMKYPANRNKKNSYKKLTIGEIGCLTIPKGERLSDTSINNYSIKISSFITWCEDNCSEFSKDLKSPLKKLVKKNVTADEERDAFSDEDLKRLFESKEYTQGSHKQPSHFWIPLLGLFTGARENELCQLYKTDVYQDVESKYWVISFNSDADDKKQKKLAHKRIVPVHNMLIELGFIDFVNSISTQRIFNELTRKRDGYADTFSKWFNRTYRNAKNCNVGQATHESKNFHSFRHTFITQLHNDRGVDQASIARMVGQKPNDSSETTDRYTKKRDIKDNYNIINRLKFSVDFKKIRKWKIV